MRICAVLSQSHLYTQFEYCHLSLKACIFFMIPLLQKIIEKREKKILNYKIKRNFLPKAERLGGLYTMALQSA